MSKKYRRKYCQDHAFQSYLTKEIRCKCKNCGHTTTVSVKYKMILCSYCGTLYENNSRAYMKKKLKQLIRGDK